ncbi:MAG: hypothetical protein K2K63_03130 [Acetatifactor sp.]|nr:hypothetical protein [Acetatifactor sp.]
MAEAHKKGFNDKLVENDLENCCRSEAVCGQCQNEACIIGFAKQCVKDYQNEPKKEVPNGVERIPTMDCKVFEQVDLEIAIAHILKECKDCKEDHVENCIINVIRNCYEVGLFGDVQPYEGSTLQYVMRLKSDFPDRSVQIAEAYRS